MAVLEGLGLNSHHAELNVLCVIALAFNFVDPESVLNLYNHLKGSIIDIRELRYLKGSNLLTIPKPLI